MSAPDHGHLPLRDYDHLSLSSLAARIRSLPAGQTTELLEYERAHAHRPQAVQILEHRRDELGRGAQPTPVTARFAEHGVGAATCLAGLDGSDDVAAVVTAALRARALECVVVGGGVRDPDEVELFEQVINLVRRHARGGDRVQPHSGRHLRRGGAVV